tara:strand:- start:149 stop:667 length:519 start_codon:yes stop_codon:yes gene_type:complete
MAYQKLQVSDGLVVIPSNDVDIPDPSTIVILNKTTGSDVSVGDFSGANTLTGTGLADLGIQVGAIVYNTTAQEAYYVVSVDSATQLTLSDGATGGGTDTFSIYNGSSNGNILYVGGAGDVNARLATYQGNKLGGSTNSKLVFKNLPNASFMPTQVVRVLVTNTTATDIIALF